MFRLTIKRGAASSWSGPGALRPGGASRHASGAAGGGAGGSAGAGDTRVRRRPRRRRGERTNGTNGHAGGESCVGGSKGDKRGGEGGVHCSMAVDITRAKSSDALRLGRRGSDRGACKAAIAIVTAGQRGLRSHLRSYARARAVLEERKRFAILEGSACAKTRRLKSLEL